MSGEERMVYQNFIDEKMERIENLKIQESQLQCLEQPQFRIAALASEIQGMENIPHIQEIISSLLNKAASTKDDIKSIQIECHFWESLISKLRLEIK